VFGWWYRNSDVCPHNSGSNL